MNVAMRGATKSANLNWPLWIVLESWGSYGTDLRRRKTEIVEAEISHVVSKNPPPTPTQRTTHWQCSHVTIVFRPLPLWTRRPLCPKSSSVSPKTWTQVLWLALVRADREGDVLRMASIKEPWKENPLPMNNNLVRIFLLTPALLLFCHSSRR